MPRSSWRLQYEQIQAELAQLGLGCRKASFLFFKKERTKSILVDFHKIHNAKLLGMLG
jgi:hypothetical protein